jgi:hypothetical protein
MIPVPHVVNLRCNYCSKEKPAHRCHRVGTAGQICCDYCLEWHLHALDVLGGAMPKGCQECGQTWDQLRESGPLVEGRVYVVPKDGMQQVLCRVCVAKYLPKRADLYKGTQFGSETLKI